MNFATELHLVIFVMIGATILWAKSKRNKRDIYGLTEFVNLYVRSKKRRLIWELVIFLGFGSIISMGIVAPATPMQALAAGLGWTSITSRG